MDPETKLYIVLSWAVMFFVGMVVGISWRNEPPRFC